MKRCPYCQAELLDAAVMCPQCKQMVSSEMGIEQMKQGRQEKGTDTQPLYPDEATIAVMRVVSDKRSRRIKWIILSVLGVLLLTLLVLLAITLRASPQFYISDTEESSKLSILLNYGFPDRIEDGFLEYDKARVNDILTSVKTDGDVFIFDYSVDLHAEIGAVAGLQMDDFAQDWLDEYNELIYVHRNGNIYVGQYKIRFYPD